MALIHRPLDCGLNHAIVAMTEKLLPAGYDVQDDAPDTYDALRAHLESGRRMCVWAGGSASTIYGEARINHAFRAWHDICHYVGRFAFDLPGESAACELQCRQLAGMYGDTLATRRWRAIIRAEIIGQARYQSRHQRFPDDQAGFVVAYLADAESALAATWW